MTNEEKQLLEELKAKKKLSGPERAKLRTLERLARLADKEAEADSKPQSNVFATKPTTKIHPLPIRFTSDERSGLTELANDIKGAHKELVITELGNEREINDTKLIRAAVYLLGQHSHEEIIEAIKQVKLNMIR